MCSIRDAAGTSLATLATLARPAEPASIRPRGSVPCRRLQHDEVLRSGCDGPAWEGICTVLFRSAGTQSPVTRGAPVVPALQCHHDFGSGGWTKDEPLPQLLGTRANGTDALAEVRALYRVTLACFRASSAVTAPLSHFSPPYTVRGQLLFSAADVSRHLGSLLFIATASRRDVLVGGGDEVDGLADLSTGCAMGAVIREAGTAGRMLVGRSIDLVEDVGQKFADLRNLART